MRRSSAHPSLAVVALLSAAILTPAQSPQPAGVTVAPFVIAGDASATDPARSACPAGATATVSGVTPEQQAALLASIGQQLSTRLAAQPLPSAADGPLLVTGSITRMEAGSKAKRVIGLTMGASYLSANVRLLRHTPTGDTPLRTFTVDIKGDNPAPPVFGGAIYNAVHNKKVSIEADALKLADRIAEQCHQPDATTSVASATSH